MGTRRKLNRFKLVMPRPETIEKYVSTYPAKQLYHQPEQLPPITAQQIFHNSQPLIFDFGCGRGEFIVRQALDHPTYNFIGVDYHWKSLLDGVNRAHEHRLENIHFIRADLRWLLRCIPDQSSHTVYLLFPPPIKRAKYAKNDVFTTAFIQDVHRILRHDGTFHFVTDIAPYFDRKMALVDKLGLLTRVTLQQSFEGGLTWYQKVWESHGLPSLRVVYVKDKPYQS
ncbi:MAG: methyltransferase [Chloroflexota bacterium]